MNKPRSLAIASSVILLASMIVAPSFAAGNPNCIEVDGQYIVSFVKGANVANEVKNVNGRQITPKYMYTEAINGFAAFLTGDEVCHLKKRPNIEDVEADQIITADATQTPATWGLDRIDQTNLPLNNTYSYTSSGAGVDAYVIDTGILSTHTEFAGRVKSGYTAINDGNSWNDCNGHGTHVSGTIGGSTFGVAKSVNLIPVRVLDCSGSGSYSGVIAGINFAITDHTTAKAVANMSLGGPTSSALDTAVNNLIKDGVTVVVAAGNSRANACNFSPSRVPAAITVAASTSTDAIASYSNFGKCVDIIAPGSSITSAWFTGTTSTNTISGTSMASPHVAGAIARALIVNSTANNILASAISNRISGLASGTPNKLLYLAPSS